VTSTQREVAAGRRIARRVERDMTLADEPLQERVRAIGARIAAVSDRKELQYRFAVIEEESVNAFSLPGGYIFVNTGLVEKAGSDDELAGVIAHEVAHVAARHAVKRFEGAMGLQIAQLAALATGDSQVARGVGMAATAAQLAYSRQDELDADRLAVKYAREAGFDPKAILTFLAKLQEVHRKHAQYLPRGIVRPQYALTHPYVPERLRAAKEALYGVADYFDYLNTEH